MNKSKKRKKLEIYEFVVYYILPTLLIMIPFLSVVLKEMSIQNISENISVFIFLLFAIFIVYNKYNGLYFYTSSSLNITEKDFEKVVYSTGAKMGWISIEKKNNHFIAHAKGLVSWGEMITIYWNPNDEKVYINSISDPLSRPTISSFGSNEKNMKGFIEYFGYLIIFVEVVGGTPTTAKDSSIHNDPEEKRQAALKMGANLVLFAFMQLQ